MIRRVVDSTSETSITEAMLISSDVPEPEAGYSTYAAGTSYALGANTIYNHKIYESLQAANVGHTPATSPTWWLDCGYDNRWKMFDSVVGSQTVQAESITVTITPGLIDSIAFLDLEAATIDLVMTDPVEGIVYSESIDLVEKSFIVDAYTYFFEPIITDDSVVLLGVPAYGNASIEITISNPGSVAKCGSLVVGTQKDVGCTQQNPTISINDYSKKDVDEYGNYSIIERTFSKRMSCETWISNSAVDGLHKELAKYRATPVVWVGTNDGSFSSMIVYGFYKSFSIAIAYPDYSIVSLEIEGLS